MNSIAVIFALAYGAVGLVHVLNCGDRASHADARRISGRIIVAAWILAVLRLISLAQYA